MNIIVLVCDALRASSLGCYGYDKNTSPEIDKIARNGIRFSNAFATANSTDVSFTTIFTGKYPTTHGICHHGNKITNTEKKYTTNLLFLPEVLHEKGFVTIGLDWLGRWHKWGYDFYAGVNNDLCKRSSDRKIQAGSQRSPAWLPLALKKYIQKLFLIRSHCNWYYSLPSYMRKYVRNAVEFYNEKKHISLSGRKTRPIVTDSAGLTDSAIRYVKKYAGKRDFFLFVHYWDTHTPYTAPKKIINDFLSKYDYSNRKVSSVLKDLAGTKSAYIVKKSTRKRTPKTIGEIIAHYDASIRYVDSNIGRLCRFLKEIDILNDTLVILTSDHGESLDEHGIFFNHHGLYEPQVNVPLIMFGAKCAKGVVYDELVQHFDITPTIMDYVGIKEKEYEFDGASLLSLTRDNNWNRKFVFAEEKNLQQKRMIRDKEYKYIQALNDDMCLYCQKYHARGDEFYNLKNDPKEENNIIEDPKHKMYKQELDNYINALAKPLEGREIEFDDEEEITKRLEALGYL